MTAALTIAIVEALAVGLWFGLVVGSGTTAAALLGLGILLCGSFLRAGIFDSTVSDTRSAVYLRRGSTAITLAAGWVSWLLIAEFLAGPTGLIVATVFLTGLLTTQFCFERRLFQPDVPPLSSFGPVLSAALLAIGASTLLATAWFADWTNGPPLVELEIASVVVLIEAVQVAALAFVCCAFLAHQYRVQQLLDSSV
ncbi:uncharacterized protein Nmag_0039 [Natrialba magadii ATCC 43099]|uniref:Uncharacterized protein n=2 Tax=Natrialba magadii TaxID=13769 RepID=D3SVR9_NATMM|nr:hypothetical protein [Natrialba magadii]ADD03638.1 uncharacterized protein Nmag_0039 [Natrialba magadii ATCC 43099]ELY34405.1 hypothetical protein C500_00682 [Natrialba magadii ATCC 43099]